MNSTTTQLKPWICAQMGAREHYVIPRVLAKQQKLERLLTDFWWPTTKLLPSKAAGRWHPELSNSKVVELNGQGVARDCFGRLFKKPHWDQIQARNEWFQKAQLKKLQYDVKKLESLAPGVFFAYSYAAGSLLKFFRELGWKTLLGQIDAGPHDALIVAQEIRDNPHIESHWQPPPERYWDHLREEHDLADTIVVNSEWSRQLCLKAGVCDTKLKVLPLAYESAEHGVHPESQEKVYPEQFNQHRPLRVLFLGQVSLRKGIHYVFDSIQQLSNDPVELVIVGALDIRLPAAIRNHPQITWTGPVSRSQVAKYYASADVFILPTLSDGFALTQLEAQSWRLPVIASTHCGEVVTQDVNGLIINPLTSEQISTCLRRCVHEPGLLARLSKASRVTDKFTMKALGENLTELEID